MNRRGALPAFLPGIITAFGLTIVFVFFFFAFNFGGVGGENVVRSGVIAGNLDHAIYPEMLLQSYLQSPVSSCEIETDLLLPGHMTFQDLLRLIVSNEELSPSFATSFASEFESGFGGSYEGVWYGCSIEFFSPVLGEAPASFGAHQYPWALQVRSNGRIILDMSDATTKTIVATKPIFTPTRGIVDIELTQQGAILPLVEVIS